MHIGVPVMVVEERRGETTTYSLHYGAYTAEGNLPRLVDRRLDAGSQLSTLVPVYRWAGAANAS
jgi:hypothetical protein